MNEDENLEYEIFFSMNRIFFTFFVLSHKLKESIQNFT
jgi:hypothetical protein